ncbi:alpha-tocopherol transfer protein-like [Zophobas morio]
MHASPFSSVVAPDPTMSFKCIDVQKLYEKDKNIRKSDVEILTEWLKKQPHLPEMEEMQVVAFLHSCYYQIERAKITIDNYFTMKTHHPELFTTLNETQLRKSMSAVFVKVLPKTTPEGYVVFLLKLLDFKADYFNFFDQVCVINMVSTLYLHQNGFETGAVIVFDSKGFTLSHLAKFNFSALKHAVDHLQEGAPVRVKSVHFINVVPVLDKVMSLIKPLLRGEVFNMLQLHPSMESFHKHIPKECMPEDYGGGVSPCQKLQDENLENCLKSYDFFQWHESQRVDEMKRVGKCASSFGIEGTFKKLNID